MSSPEVARSAPRSAGTLRHRRVAQDWPSDRPFRILSIDGGGIRGIFPATVLAELEERVLGGSPIREQFDLVTGTSTGGIIALGLAAGVSPREMANLYIESGQQIFPPYPSSLLGSLLKRYHELRSYTRFRYDRAALRRLLQEVLGDRKFGDSKLRLCIPSADGVHGDVYIFKTPHHPDYKKDQHEMMTTVACATAAAPTFFQPLDSGGYRFIDGGVWANNPVMIGLVDALSCFDVNRHQVSILSLGCGDSPYTVGEAKLNHGGQLHWSDIIHGAMSFQSQNALGQARLLIGAERLMRVDPPSSGEPIRLDDWRRASVELPPLAVSVVSSLGEAIKDQFFLS